MQVKPIRAENDYRHALSEAYARLRQFVVTRWRAIDAVWAGRRRRFRQRSEEISSFPIKEITLVLGIYAYFAGWVYAYYYYRMFYVPLSSIDIPTYYLIAYAFPAMHSWGPMLGVVAVLIFLRFVYRYRLTMFLTLMAFFVFVFITARDNGIEQAQTMRFKPDNDRIKFFFTKDSEGVLPPELIYNSEQNRLRLLTENREHIFVFYQPDPIGHTIPAMLVYDVPKRFAAATLRIVAPTR